MYLYAIKMFTIFRDRVVPGMNTCTQGQVVVGTDLVLKTDFLEYRDMLSCSGVTFRCILLQKFIMLTYFFHISNQIFDGVFVCFMFSSYTCKMVNSSRVHFLSFECWCFCCLDATG